MPKTAVTSKPSRRRNPNVVPMTVYFTPDEFAAVRSRAEKSGRANHKEVRFAVRQFLGLGDFAGNPAHQ